VIVSPEQVFVHTLEDVIYFVLTEIEHPLNLIPETPAGNFSEPDEFSEEEGFKSDMEDNNDHDEERGKPPQNN
jgi:hypothetical protein